VKLYLHSPNASSWRGAQLKHRDNFTLILPFTGLVCVFVAPYLGEKQESGEFENKGLRKIFKTGNLRHYTARNSAIYTAHLVQLGQSNTGSYEGWACSYDEGKQGTYEEFRWRNILENVHLARQGGDRRITLKSIFGR
jgi:hypothetical protein